MTGSNVPPGGGEKAAPKSQTTARARRGQTCRATSAADGADFPKSVKARSRKAHAMALQRRLRTSSSAPRPQSIGEALLGREAGLAHCVVTILIQAAHPCHTRASRGEASSGVADPYPPRAERPDGWNWHDAHGFKSQRPQAHCAAEPANGDRARHRSKCRPAARPARGIRSSLSATPSSAFSCCWRSWPASCFSSAPSASTRPVRCRRIASSTSRMAPACAILPMS